MPNRILTPVLATPESLAGYGWLIGEPEGPARDRIDFYGKEVVVHQPARFHGNDDLTLNLVTFARRPLEVKWMEYHAKHTQTFIPLGGRPFWMVLGKPTRLGADGVIDETREALPDPDNVQAFYFDGSGGLVMDVGVWHEVPFPAEAGANFVVICTNETNDNLEAQGADGECDGGDLDKKNMTKRLGYTFEIRP
ncbi:ureidoglycolate lyase [Phenylobacterium aquaticum]|uniref:ureidoglycolate lyase n=1 Tax=Phenylobacterium aquaticum TaxID=1763816 RepID=UPI0026EC8C5E|nr:ureidoglycolate lyase [Phenylobacterium aquaticum]